MGQLIYTVWANHDDRRVLLGYAEGAIADIAAYYDDRKAYGLDIERVDPLVIPAGYASKRSSLLKRKAELEAELETINNQIKVKK